MGYGFGEVRNYNWDLQDTIRYDNVRIKYCNILEHTIVDKNIT